MARFLAPLPLDNGPFMPRERSVTLGVSGALRQLAAARTMDPFKLAIRARRKPRTTLSREINSTGVGAGSDPL
ncbi:unnamed protein product [Leptosia nina]|uniref:Uncharacterized protein n=1 Tax=Leptosia nina TaxID=320188 RepID=A0AAV1IZ27_9NEOP